MASNVVLLFVFTSLVGFVTAVPEAGIREMSFNKDDKLKDVPETLYEVVDRQSQFIRGNGPFSLLLNEKASTTIKPPKSNRKVNTQKRKTTVAMTTAKSNSRPSKRKAPTSQGPLPNKNKNNANGRTSRQHGRNPQRKGPHGKGLEPLPGRHKRAVKNATEKQPSPATVGRMRSSHSGLVTAVTKDGNYLLRVSVSRGALDPDYNVEITVKIKSDKYGFLSAAEWPLLPFYGAMSLLYLAYGVVWLIVSACQWRELLRIQFWIGGVIALGMLEKAVLFSEYNNVNNTGVPAHGLIVFGLVISCIKRTLSRILIIIVSLGFGIVKPRLGAALHRVLAVGFLYFILCVIEGAYREKSLKADVENKQLIAAIPLSILDAVICWWIFMSLMQTMRTLRIRKNIVKLSLYRHFTNILVFSVIASVAFMIWSIKSYHLNACIKDWKELWIDEAFWHFLFAIVLLAIMVLWRPTANNQRYAFTPLIDIGDDDEDDDMTLSDAFNGMKMRNKSEGDVSSRVEKNRIKLEDDLKWVEENIPTAGGIDTALPTLMDSDEEVMTTKLEMSKME